MSSSPPPLQSSCRCLGSDLEAQRTCKEWGHIKREEDGGRQVRLDDALTRHLRFGSLVVDRLAGQGVDSDLGDGHRGVFQLAVQPQDLSPLAGVLHHLNQTDIREWVALKLLKNGFGWENFWHIFPQKRRRAFRRFIMNVCAMTEYTIQTVLCAFHDLSLLKYVLTENTKQHSTLLTYWFLNMTDANLNPYFHTFFMALFFCL